MSRWKVPAVGICVCFLVVVTLLTILFVVMNKHPETRMDLFSTDMRLLDRVSSVWCGSQQITSSHRFTAYRITGEPSKERTASTSFHLTHTIKLRWGRERNLKYHLLPGSTVEIGACSDRPGVILRIFQTIRKWKECRRLRKSPHPVSDTSSSEESDEDTRSRSRRNEHSLYPPDCDEAMRRYDVPSRNDCKTTGFPLTVDSENTYVFSMEDYHNAADESSTEVKILLNRTRYRTENAMAVCYDVSICEVPLSFGSEERTVVAVREEFDAGAVSYAVVAKCKPRVFFFIFLFAFIPLLLLLCIGCVIFCSRRVAGKKTTVKYIQVANSEQSRDTPSNPLLSGAEVTIYSRADRYHRPPAYPESTAPPPYAPFEISPLEANKSDIRV